MSETEALDAMHEVAPRDWWRFVPCRTCNTRGDLTAVRHSRRDYVYDLDAEEVVLAQVEVGHARYRLGEVLDQSPTTRSRSRW